MTHSSPEQTAADEAEIYSLMAKWSRALEAKDAEALVGNYQDDTVLFDAIPPFVSVGKGAAKAVWQQCLPYFPEKLRSEHKDLTVQVDGDLAVVYGFHHIVPDPADHPCGTTWMRVTVCLHRTAGEWNVVHAHISVPFDPMTGQASMAADL